MSVAVLVYAGVLELELGAALSVFSLAEATVRRAPSPARAPRWWAREA